MTGDKGATANQIGLSCGVLSADREIVHIEDDTSIAKELKLGKDKDVLISGQAISNLLNDP